MVAQIEYFPNQSSGYLASKLHEHLQYRKGCSWKRYSSYQSLKVGPTKVLRIWYVAPRTARVEVCNGLYALLQHKLKGWQESNGASKAYTCLLYTSDAADE